MFQYESKASLTAKVSLYDAGKIDFPADIINITLETTSSGVRWRDLKRSIKTIGIIYRHSQAEKERNRTYKNQPTDAEIINYSRDPVPDRQIHVNYRSFIQNFKENFHLSRLLSHFILIVFLSININLC